MFKRLACALPLIMAFTHPARADVDSVYIHSLEWLTDASSSIQLATVVREKHPVTGAWTSRVKSVERVLKAVGAKKAVPLLEDVTAAISVPGENRVLLFLRPAPPGKRAPEIFYTIYLNKHLVPANPVERAASYRAALPTGFDRPGPAVSRNCVAVDRKGRVLVEPDAVVGLVQGRARQWPNRVADTGFHAPRGEEIEDQNSVYYLRVPFDAEERAGFLEKLSSRDGHERAEAATHLEHYPDAEVIASLRNCLRDTYSCHQQVKDPRGGPPRGAEIYVVRQAAYRSLCRLKVKVSEPALERE